MRFLGKCFDRADWETICEGNDTVDKGTFTTTITLRNHAPSLRAWLEFWRLDELTEQVRGPSPAARPPPPARVPLSASQRLSHEHPPPPPTQLEIADVMTPTDLIILDQKEIDKVRGVMPWGRSAGGVRRAARRDTSSVPSATTST